MILIKNPFLLGFTLLFFELIIKFSFGSDIVGSFTLLVFLLVFLGLLVGAQIKPLPGHSWYSFKVVVTYTVLVMLVAIPTLLDTFGNELTPFVFAMGYILMMSVFGYLFFVLGQQLADKFINKSPSLKLGLGLTLLFGVLVIGGLLTSVVYTELQETHSVEQTRLAIRDSLKEYKAANGTLVNYCDSALYDAAVSNFIGESECMPGTDNEGKDFTVTLFTINAVWECKLQYTLDHDAEIFTCGETELKNQAVQESSKVTSTEVTSEVLFPDSRTVPLKIAAYDLFDISMQVPTEWEEQGHGFKYRNTQDNLDPENGITEMIEIEPVDNAYDLELEQFAKTHFDLLTKMKFAYSDYRLQHFEPVSIDGRKAVYTRATEFRPNGNPDFIEDRYFILENDKILIAKYRREAEITPIDFVAIVETLQFSE